MNENLSSVEKAVESLKSGGGIIIVDDFDRENEGDLVFFAENITESQMAMLIRECSGIVCLCITADKAESLNLPLMVQDNTSRFKTAFTVSVEAAEGVTTGVSAHDRVVTIKTAVANDAKPEHLNRPGHVFPLIARKGGLMERRGHTEATIEMMKLAGLKPCGVLCELTNTDGTMAKMPEIIAFSEQHKIPVIAVDEIVQKLVICKNSLNHMNLM
ncbi:MAG TPA: 3,4-dihydroxy-2-butanone-4-phosphate synthase [bacterium]|nr:3,4-dihydroxy-2-butanone-4-phosphate synthase [bacterium]